VIEIVDVGPGTGLGLGEEIAVHVHGRRVPVKGIGPVRSIHRVVRAVDKETALRNGDERLAVLLGQEVDRA
jgi:hypothetical protein